MPELPEVETICQGLAPLIIGKTIAAIKSSGKSLRQPVPLAEMTAALPGQTIKGIRRRAKYLLIECGGLLIIHLGMTGNLGLFPAKMPPEKHCHVRFHFNSGDELRYRDSRRFGRIVFFPAPFAEAERQFFATTGPEPFACDAAWLAAKTSGMQAPVKAALLNGTLIAGIGNIYASESLFRARIGPQRATASLTMAEWQRLLAAIQEVLREAIICGGSTISDYVNAQQKSGCFQMNFMVYGRSGQTCHQCGATITQTRIAGRSTFFCPQCQNAPE
ncbi:MAG: bifunctional DNA-formamidopyrimidine glycosylase/DNA-(apurinic or apyrimidinic site) lyase [Desulfobulbaceae bacterium]|jgi:formamidopyrimidine-DNA glycosylase|nr:bifunctional DNA-formamidopyrimidine glycosylase/DNA-(apurinic or apyrimidinic site) lyase [Desulfobulbaceae bacterium]